MVLSSSINTGSKLPKYTLELHDAMTGASARLYLPPRDDVMTDRADGILIRNWWRFQNNQDHFGQEPGQKSKPL